MKIAYTYVAIDIFHYGHLKLLLEAKSKSDIHICGLLTDEVCKNWNGSLIMNYDERNSILKSLDCVDKVMIQDSIDPTINLKKIKSDNPNADIILFQGHQDWRNMPGTDFIRSIGGKIIKPKYYPRLSRDFISTELSKKNPKGKIDFESYMLGKISFFQISNSTKANTLETLSPLLKKSTIEPLFIFKLKQWKNHSKKIITEIQNKFSQKIVVRSSSSSEDGINFSNAGLFHSELNVDSKNIESIKNSIQKVIESYKKNSSLNDSEQILIQAQTRNVEYSGVIFTRDIEENAPYYVINFDKSKETDTVTSGAVDNSIKMLRSTKMSDIPKPWKDLIAATKEIEDLLDGLALDIEFALNKKGKVIIFQVRPLAATQKFISINDKIIYNEKNRILGSYNDLKKDSLFNQSYTLSDMSFWNPAEIIGGRSDPLSYSLYHHLILKKAWNVGLISLGYKKVDRPLMVRLANKPYIEVETAFKALLPESISNKTERLLLNYFIKKLQENPELHDKIEFEISLNCFTPSTNEDLKEIQSLVTPRQFKEIRENLILLTSGIFSNYSKIEKEDIKSLKILENKRKSLYEIFQKSSLQKKIIFTVQLLSDTIDYGTIQFSRMARLAFIGNQYLKSFVKSGVIKDSEYENFFSSIDTVASELNIDFNKVLMGNIDVNKFNNIYGHLRPGTYNICKLPYSKNPDYFSINDKAISTTNSTNPSNEESDFKLKIDNYLKDFEIKISSKDLLDFTTSTTKNREYFKFEFTKNLSLALEWLVEIGNELSFSRDDLSYLTLENLSSISEDTPKNEIIDFWSSQINGRKQKIDVWKYISLPSIIFDENSLKIIKYQTARPNFITSKKTQGKIIDAEMLSTGNYDKINGKIVLLEKADPGFDWIFSKNIIALITKFGGAASHMAIRCAEFSIPAAIGCGDMLYDRLKKANTVDLDCKNQLITIVV